MAFPVRSRFPWFESESAGMYALSKRAIASSTPFSAEARAAAGPAAERRSRVRTQDYWDVFFSANENMKKRFDAEGIRGPVPQREVRLHQA